MAQRKRVTGKTEDGKNTFMPKKSMTWTDKEYNELIEFKDGQIKLAFWFAAIVGCLIGIAIGKFVL